MFRAVRCAACNFEKIYYQPQISAELGNGSRFWQKKLKVLEITEFGKCTKRNPACLNPWATMQFDSNSTAVRHMSEQKGAPSTTMVMHIFLLHARLLNSITEVKKAGESITLGFTTNTCT